MEHSHELRALQRKAYGPGGTLTDAEAARLRELEGERGTGPSEPAAPPVLAVPVFASPAFPATPAQERMPEPAPEMLAARAIEEPAEPEEPVEALEHPAPRRVSRWKIFAAASVLLVLVGFAAAALIFVDRSRDVALSADEEARRLTLSESDWLDPGSVRAIGRDDDALVWYGTRGDGTRSCIALDVGDQQGSFICEDSDSASTGGTSTMAFSTIDGGTQVIASAVRTPRGDVLAVVQRYANEQTSSTSWMDQFPAEYRTRVAELEGNGYDSWSEQLVGSFRDAPVWAANRSGDGTTATCLIVDAVAVEQCATIDQADVEVVVDLDDGTRLALSQSSSWFLTLTITEVDAEGAP